MTMFLTIAAALALVTMLAVLFPLFGRTRTPETRDQKDARLFRQQLAEVDRDLERGVIRPEEAEGARAEISRRLIAAVGRAEAVEAAHPAPRGATGLVAGVALLGLPLLAGAAYLSLGEPGKPDLPFAARGLQPSIDTASRGGAGSEQPQRPTQAQAEEMIQQQPPAPTEEQAEFAALVKKLEKVVAERGDDVQGLALLANGYARLGRNAEAWPVYERLIEAQGEDATAELYALQAESMVLATDGYVSPEAERVIGEALEKDPSQQIARYYSGLAHAQAGRFDRAVEVWQALRDDAPEDAPWAAPLDQMIAEAQAAKDGTAPGPSAEDMETAAEMSPEERREMIEGMVQGLEARLTSEGGEPDEWIRLMSSYARLGRTEDARRVYELGREALGSDGGASALRQQALVLGIISE